MLRVMLSTTEHDLTESGFDLGLLTLSYASLPRGKQKILSAKLII